MNRGEKLLKVIKEKGYNVSKLSKESGVAYSTIDSMIKRNLKNASIDNVLTICRILGISAETFEDINKPPNLQAVEGDFIRVPILGEISCGDPIYAAENFAGYRVETKDSLPGGNTYYLQTKGDSMSPTIPKGSYVLIREQSEVENGEIAAVLLNNDNEATLKRIRKSNGTIMLLPDNNEYDPIIVNENNPAIILGKAMRYTFDL